MLNNLRIYVQMQFDLKYGAKLTICTKKWKQMTAAIVTIEVTYLNLRFRIVLMVNYDSFW